MAKNETRSAFGDAGFEEWIGNSGNRLHGLNAGADVRSGNSLSAQIAEFSKLDEILEAVVGSDGDESSSLPRAEVPGGDAQYAKYILAAISIHWGGTPLLMFLTIIPGSGDGSKGEDAKISG
jgi:hypothetical protein